MHICTSGSSCLAKLLALESNEINLQPTLVILEGTTALEAQRTDNQSTWSVKPSISHSTPYNRSQPSEIQESNLLRTITTQIARSNLSSLVVPLVFIQSSEDVTHIEHRQNPSRDKPLVTYEMLRCMDEGAIDVYFSPLALDHIRSIASHAYRIRKDKSKQGALFQEAKKVRKRSWVGIDDRKPYAYLREEMYVI